MPSNAVLVVEDKDEGAQFKELLEETLKVGVSWARDGKGAVEAVENNLIKVAVLDQRLEETHELGTEVYAKLKAIRPELKAIMFSAVATQADIGHALGLGFSKYLNKTDVLQLPEAVLEVLVAANLALAKAGADTSRRLLHTFRKGTFSFKKFEVFLVRRALIDKNFLFEGRWKELLHLEAGHQVQQEVEFELETETVVEVKSSFELEAKYSLKAEVLKNALENELAAKSALESKVSHTLKKKERAKFSEIWTGPPIPPEVDKDYLASKSFQANQVYEKYLNVVEVVCPYCKLPETVSVLSYTPTRMVARRQVDYYKSGRTENIDTGVVTK